MVPKSWGWRQRIGMWSLSSSPQNSSVALCRTQKSFLSGFSYSYPFFLSLYLDRARGFIPALIPYCTVLHREPSVFVGKEHWGDVVP